LRVAARQFAASGVKLIRAASARLGSRSGDCRRYVLLNTMPKSGSVYVTKSLARILRLGTMHIGNNYALIEQINVREATIFSGGGFVSQNHLAPSPENLQILRRFNLKMVLHLRDPRQALLSWVHHLDWTIGGNELSENLLYVAPQTPPGYFALPLARKIDWQIENFLPQLMAWTEKWVDIADRGTIPVLITHQDDLRCREKAFFDAILRFYEFDLDYDLPRLPRTIETTHFRLADPTEWRRTFTPEQAARATAQIPQVFRARFGWDDRLTVSTDAVERSIKMRRAVWRWRGSRTDRAQLAE